MNQPPLVVTNFIAANPTLPAARSLKSRFVNELARRTDWRGLLAFSPDKPATTKRSVTTTPNSASANRRKPGAGRKSCG